MFIPGSRFPGVKKKLVVIPFFVGKKISQNCKLFYFWNAEEKSWANFQRIIEIFTQKIVTKLSKIWVWDCAANLLALLNLLKGKV
jgi:hypothetical protein